MAGQPEQPQINTSSKLMDKFSSLSSLKFNNLKKKTTENSHGMVCDRKMCDKVVNNFMQKRGSEVGNGDSHLNVGNISNSSNGNFSSSLSVTGHGVMTSVFSLIPLSVNYANNADDFDNEAVSFKKTKIESRHSLSSISTDTTTSASSTSSKRSKASNNSMKSNHSDGKSDLSTTEEMDVSQIIKYIPNNALHSNESPSEKAPRLRKEVSESVLCTKNNELGSKIKSKNLSSVELISKMKIDISTSFLIGKCSESFQSKTYVENILQELYTTEKNYVKDLKDIIQGYYNPLFKEIPYNDFNGIFGNIKSVHKFNRKFLKDLSQCKEDVVEVSKLFISHEEDFKVYTAYCTDYPKAQQILRDYSHYPEYNLKLLRCQQHLRHPLPLYTYLFKPVQRVLKYPLLLQNLISHHDSDAVGYDVLLAAHECMLRLAEDINEVKRNQEKVERLIEIQNCIEGVNLPDVQSFGKLLMEGDLYMLGLTREEVHVVLLQKAAFILKKKRKENKLVFKYFIKHRNLMLIETVPREPHCFKIMSNRSHKNIFTLQASSLKEKDVWCHEFKKVILDSITANIPDKARKLLLKQENPTKDVSSRDRKDMLGHRRQSDSILDNTGTPSNIEKRQPETSTPTSDQFLRSTLRSTAMARIRDRKHSRHKARKKILSKRRSKSLENIQKSQSVFYDNLIPVNYDGINDSNNSIVNLSDAQNHYSVESDRYNNYHNKNNKNNNNNNNNNNTLEIILGTAYINNNANTNNHNTTANNNICDDRKYANDRNNSISHNNNHNHNNDNNDDDDDDGGCKKFNDYKSDDDVKCSNNEREENTKEDVVNNCVGCSAAAAVHSCSSLSPQRSVSFRRAMLMENNFNVDQRKPPLLKKSLSATFSSEDEDVCADDACEKIEHADNQHRFNGKKDNCKNVVKIDDVYSLPGRQSNQEASSETLQYMHENRSSCLEETDIKHSATLSSSSSSFNYISEDGDEDFNANRSKDSNNSMCRSLAENEILSFKHRQNCTVNKFTLRQTSLDSISKDKLNDTSFCNSYDVDCCERSKCECSIDDSMQFNLDDYYNSPVVKRKSILLNKLIDAIKRRSTNIMKTNYNCDENLLNKTSQKSTTLKRRSAFYFEKFVPQRLQTRRKVSLSSIDSLMKDNKSLLSGGRAQSLSDSSLAVVPHVHVDEEGDAFVRKTSQNDDVANAGESCAETKINSRCDDEGDENDQQIAIHNRCSSTPVAPSTMLEVPSQNRNSGFTELFESIANISDDISKSFDKLKLNDEDDICDDSLINNDKNVGNYDHFFKTVPNFVNNDYKAAKNNFASDKKGKLRSSKSENSDVGYSTIRSSKEFNTIPIVLTPSSPCSSSKKLDAPILQFLESPNNTSKSFGMFTNKSYVFKLARAYSNRFKQNMGSPFKSNSCRNSNKFFNNYKNDRTNSVDLSDDSNKHDSDLANAKSNKKVSKTKIVFNKRPMSSHVLDNTYDTDSEIYADSIASRKEAFLKTGSGTCKDHLDPETFTKTKNSSLNKKS